MTWTDAGKQVAIGAGAGIGVMLAAGLVGVRNPYLLAVLGIAGQVAAVKYWS